MVSSSLQRSCRSAPGMASGGVINALRTVPVGDKVALGEVVSRELFTSLTPAKSSVEESLEEGLRGGHSSRPVRSGDCFSCFPSSLAAMSAKDSLAFNGGRSSPRQAKLSP